MEVIMRNITLSLLLLCFGCIIASPVLNAGCARCEQARQNNKYNASTNNYFYYEDYQEAKANKASR
jgi:hypothetical protein